MKELNFTAIDFETMTPERTSACSIGLARVENGVITEKYYTLIKPIPDNRTNDNSKVNGITPDMVKDAPTFKEAWTKLQPFLDHRVLAAHKADFDADVLTKVCEYYGIECSVPYFIDSYDITKEPLDMACMTMGIPLDSHHDALCDAVACAEIILKANGKVVPVMPSGQFGKHIKAKDLKSETKQPLDPEKVANKDTTFFMKKVVLTGNLQRFPKREEVAELLRKYGADINTSISRKTDIVIVGTGAGPSKMKKIAELKEQGYEIRVIEEQEFLQIISNENIH